MQHRRAFAVPLAVFFFVGCGGGMRFEPIAMDRPNEGIGLPPPVSPDYSACYTGHAEGLDINGDGKPEYVRVKDDGGHDVCHGSDSDHDGKIDQWDVMSGSGKVTKRVRDTNGNGRADERWSFDPTNQCATIFRDANEDGQPDGQPVDTCRPLDTAPPPPAAPTTSASSAAPPAAP